jgi:succinyl-CoA synthetase alpha subunit
MARDRAARVLTVWIEGETTPAVTVYVAGRDASKAARYAHAIAAVLRAEEGTREVREETGRIAETVPREAPSGVGSGARS